MGGRHGKTCRGNLGRRDLGVDGVQNIAVPVMFSMWPMLGRRSWLTVSGALSEDQVRLIAAWLERYVKQ
jgi:hypothetical protein